MKVVVVDPLRGVIQRGVIESSAVDVHGMRKEYSNPLNYDQICQNTLQRHDGPISPPL